MPDLVVAVIAQLLFSAVLFAAGLLMARRLRRHWALLVAALAVGILILHVGALRGHIGWSRVLPWSGMLVLSDVLLPAAALLAGIAAGITPGGRWRRLPPSSAIVALALWTSYQPLIPDRIGYDERWSDGVCLQSRASSCAPAAAATLLHAHGISASEADLARLSLTRADGTIDLGLFRGLALASASSGYRVECFTGAIGDLWREPRPVLLFMRLEDDADADPRFAREWGWIPGVSHVVVLFGISDEHGQDRLEIGDPAIGRERWDLAALRTLWTGWGLRLTPR